MAKLSFYEQVGIVIPGALFLAVFALIVPTATAVAAPQDISIGKFGVFLLLAYAAGHAIAALGNVLEAAWWGLRGGMPSDWVVYDDDRIIDSAQKELLREKIHERLHLTLPAIVGLARKKWQPVFRQLYGRAMSTNPGRIEALNGNYGLNRGLASAALALTITSAIVQPHHWAVTAMLAGAALIYGFRMHLFGVGFAREVYNCFLNAPPAASPKA
jgi:hypothetical protein